MPLPPHQIIESQKFANILPIGTESVILFGGNAPPDYSSLSRMFECNPNLNEVVISSTSIFSKLGLLPRGISSLRIYNGMTIPLGLLSDFKHLNALEIDSLNAKLCWDEIKKLPLFYLSLTGGSFNLFNEISMIETLRSLDIVGDKAKQLCGLKSFSLERLGVYNCHFSLLDSLSLPSLVELAISNSKNITKFDSLNINQLIVKCCQKLELAECSVEKLCWLQTHGKLSTAKVAPFLKKAVKLKYCFIGAFRNYEDHDDDEDIIQLTQLPESLIVENFPDKLTTTIAHKFSGINVANKNKYFVNGALVDIITFLRRQNDISSAAFIKMLKGSACDLAQPKVCRSSP